jgi:hypothetical protein
MKQQFSPSALLPVISANKNNNGAEFTVVSKATGKDFTFKINRSEFNGKFYTHVKVEQEYMNFRYLGTYFMGAIRRKREVIKTPAAVAIAWVLDKVEKGKISLLEESIELMHLGCCLRCGRALTDQESIRIGLGPVCRNI